jgi:hypothetical protein
MIILSESGRKSFLSKPSNANGIENKPDTWVSNQTHVTSNYSVSGPRHNVLRFQWNPGNTTNHGTDVGWSCYRCGRVSDPTPKQGGQSDHTIRRATNVKKRSFEAM